MIRAIALFGMAGGFFAISPRLREDVADMGTQSYAFLNAHSPLSYVVAGVVALGLLALVARSAAAQH